MTTRQKKHEMLLEILVQTKSQKKKKSHSIMNVIARLFAFICVLTNSYTIL